MALPYMLLATRPSLLAMLPKPGPWMVTLKEFLSFPIFATCVWLLWVLGQETGADGFALALSPGVLLYAFIGCLVGTLVGVLPGIGPLAGISLLACGTSVYGRFR